MDLELEGKKAVVTGGSRGIGRAIARRLAMEGCDVAIGARTAGPLAESAAALAKETGRRVLPLACDTMDPESIKQFMSGAAEGLGGIHILVNGAARMGGSSGDVFTVDVDDVVHDFEEKVGGYLRCAQAALPYMQQAGWGRIINISGGAGRSPGQGIGAGARNSATINMTKALANSVGRYGINVNAIYPGQTMTESVLERFAAQAQQAGTTVETFMQEQADRQVTKHLVTPDDIANVVAFLCSPLALSITGEAIAVDGGASKDVHF